MDRCVGGVAGRIGLELKRVIFYVWVGLGLPAAPFLSNQIFYNNNCVNCDYENNIIAIVI